jgi:Protein of unknown function (DUF3185)
MIKAAAFMLLAGGILLAVFGLNAMNSASSQFTGALTDQAPWMLAGGIAMVIAGFAGLLPVFRKD